MAEAQSIKVKDVNALLAEMNPEADLTISMDVSTSDGTAQDRVFATELFGWQGNCMRNEDDPKEALDVSLLLRGEPNFELGSEPGDAPPKSAKSLIYRVRGERMAGVRQRATKAGQAAVLAQQLSGRDATAGDAEALLQLAADLLFTLQAKRARVGA